MKVKPFSFGQKLWLTFASIGLISLLALIIMRLGLSTISVQLDSLLNVHEPLNEAAHEMEINTIGTGIGVLKYIQTGEQRYRDWVAEDRSEFLSFQRQFSQHAKAEPLRDVGIRSRQLYDNFYRLAENIMAQSDQYQKLLSEAINSAIRLHAAIHGQRLLLANRNDTNSLKYRELLDIFELELNETLLWFTHASLSHTEHSLAQTSIDADEGLVHARNLAELRSQLDVALIKQNAFAAPFDALLKLLQTGANTWEQLGRDIDKFIALRVQLDELLDEELQIMAAAQQDTASAALQTSIRQANLALIGFTILFIVLVFTSSYRLIRRSRQALQALSYSATQLEKGNLQHRINPIQEAEFQQVAKAFNQMAEQLSHLTMWRPHVLSLIDSLHEALFVVKPNGHIMLANAAAYRLCGYSTGQLIGLPFDRIFPRRRDESGSDANAGRRIGFVLTSNGRRVPIDYTVSILCGLAQKSQGLIYTVSDARERLSTEERLRSMAYQDPLTGLANRALLQKRLAVALPLARKLQQSAGLIYLDVDYFKSINDIHGHYVGDQVLRIIAQRLQGALKGTSTIARIGGDEFNILLERLAEPERLAQIADSIQAHLNTAMHIDELRISITVSIGAALMEPKDTADSLIYAADSALRQAKSCGKNQIQIYNSTLSMRNTEQRRLARELRSALAEEQLLLHYQPQVFCETNAMFALEALIRWQHPKQGLLFPASFLSIAEDIGLIRELTAWVLINACRQFKELLDHGVRLQHIAVNLPAHLLATGDIVDLVKDALVQANLAPAYLELEITEDALQTTPQAIGSLNALANLGIKLALDDFGTGYSSLGSLKDLPIHVVKIDRSFIANLQHDERNQTIVIAMLAMIHSLGFLVLAEGVENEHQLTFLQALGCKAVQGYLYSAPLPFLEIQHIAKTSLLKPNSSNVNVMPA